ncbi:MAG: O-antigen ligase family protein [Acidobacteriota bacterium]|nr:O-antigen ligase family protein [Blastocatellia bacterium]MDW8241253.1 O-antigen ligase family protein [Acidobacteriota bacterium]
MIVLLALFCVFAPHSIALSQMAFFTSLALWILHLIWRRRAPVPWSVLDRPILAFVGFTLLSAIFSYEPAVSVRKLASVSLVLLFFLVTRQVRAARSARTLVVLMVASCLVNVGYVFWQKFAGHGLKIVQMSVDSPLGAAGLRPGDVILELNDRAVDSLEEMVESARRSGQSRVELFFYRPEIYIRQQVAVDQWRDVSSVGVVVAPWREFRAAGFYGWNYFTYAEVLQLLTAIACGIWLQARRKRSWLFVWLTLVVLAMSAAIVLTLTRAVWIGFAAALLVMAVRSGQRWVLALLLIAGLMVAPVAVKMLYKTRGQPMLSRAEPSTAYRLTIWQEGARLLIRQPRHWLVGVGMDSLKTRWREWGLFQGGRLPVGHMHSTPLQVALERGLPAFLCLVWWFGVYLRLLWRLTGERLSAWDWLSQGVLIGILGGTVGFLVSSLAHYNFGDSEVIMIVYFLMAVAVVMDRAGPFAGEEPGRRASTGAA